MERALFGGRSKLEVRNKNKKEKSIQLNDKVRRGRGVDQATL